jgi:hypothetical protein
MFLVVHAEEFKMKYNILDSQYLIVKDGGRNRQIGMTNGNNL